MTAVMALPVSPVRGVPLTGSPKIISMTPIAARMAATTVNRLVVNIGMVI